jgi:hypothetical protein
VRILLKVVHIVRILLKRYILIARILLKLCLGQKTGFVELDSGGTHVARNLLQLRVG